MPADEVLRVAHHGIVHNASIGHCGSDAVLQHARPGKLGLERQGKCVLVLKLLGAPIDARHALLGPVVVHTHNATKNAQLCVVAKEV